MASELARPLFERVLASKPKTYLALQNFVMSAADAFNEPPDSTKYMASLYSNLESLMGALLLEGAVPKNVTFVNMLEEIDRQVSVFKQAYPNWKDAYFMIDRVLEKEYETASSE